MYNNTSGTGLQYLLGQDVMFKLKQHNQAFVKNKK